MNLEKLIGSFDFKKFGKASRTDFGVLKVAFMVAALDGAVTDAEYRALEALAKKVPRLHAEGRRDGAAREDQGEALHLAG